MDANCAFAVSDGSKSSMSKKGSAKDLNDAHTTESGVDLSQTPSMTKVFYETNSVSQKRAEGRGV